MADRAFNPGRPNPASTYKRWGDGARVRGAICDGCGVGYLDYAQRPDRAARHFCSATCYHTKKLGAGNPKWKGGNIAKVCPICGTRFSVIPANDKVRVTCSPACGHLHRRKYPDPVTAHREHGRRREARQRAGRAIATHTYAEWLAVCALHGDRCAKCGEAKRLTRDHITPLSKGGHDGIDNIQPLCRSCNARKHNKL